MLNKQVWVPTLVVLVVGGGCFYGGLAFQKNKDSLAGVSGEELQSKLQNLGLGGSNGFPGAGGAEMATVGGGVGFIGRASTGSSASGGMTRRFGGGGVSGSILSKDDQSFTVKQVDGSTKTVYYSSTTTVDEQVTGTSSDLTVGKNVMVIGESNSDGSVAATTVSIRPENTQKAAQ